MRSDLQYDVRRFAISALETAGAAVEPQGDDSVLALLPEGIARELDLPGEYRFATEASAGSDTDVLTYGTEALSRIAEFARSCGRAARASIPTAYLKKGNMESPAKEILQVSRASRVFLGSTECLVSYLVLNIYYRAVSTETKEGIVTIVLNEASGAPVPGLAAGLDMSELSTELYDESIEETLPVERIFAAAKAIARKEIEGEITDFREMMNGRLARDWKRIDEYYKQSARETRKKIARSRKEETKARIEDKLKATEADLREKQRNVVARYAVRVEMEAAAALRIYCPAIKLSYRLKRRDVERDLTTFWNPVTKAVEALSCEVCFRTTTAFTVCDRIHLACSACAPACPSCGRRLCGVCHASGCPTCGSSSSAPT